jgi:hypothetical protein
MRELQILQNQIKNKDATLIRKDISTLNQQVGKEGVIFLRAVEAQAKKNKSSTVIFLGICL